VTFVYAEKSDALRVPNAALRFRPPADLARAAPSGLPVGSSSAEPAPAASERPRGQRGPGGGRSGPRDEPEVRTVWVLDGLEPRSVRIRTGISDGSLTEVTEGDLHEGDSLVTEMTGAEGDKPASTTPPGAPPGGGLRRVF
jgi:HlyD family secretion protein